jgi:hypothetical protein
VRDEDLDWEIYRAIADGKARTMADLAARGHDPVHVEASVGRLERSLLVERRGDSVRVLSFQEAILLCQVKNEKDSPLMLENGVVRVKTDGERKG